MDWLNIITAAFVFVMQLTATIIMIFRYRQTRNMAFIGVIFALIIMTVSYGLFTYNAIVGQSNAPLRYLLRMGTGSMALSISALSVVNAQTTRRLRELLLRSRAVNDG